MSALASDDQHAHKARLLRRVKRAVVKIGSNVLAGTGGLRRERVRALVAEIAALAAAGRQIVVVSSGAVAAGAVRLAGSGRSRSRIDWRQAAAAVGQIGLMAAYERAFAAHDRHVAQVLLTHADLADRRRYLNARHTLRTLLDLGIVPIVNENDTVAVEELAFGDNDNLSALTASLVEADLLVILSDVEGLHTRDPRLDPDAPLVRVARAQDESVARAAGPAKSGVGTGGMASKLAAARKAAAAGIPTLIADGTREGVLAAIFDPAAETGTLLLADGDRLAHRKHWIAYAIKPTVTSTSTRAPSARSPRAAGASSRRACAASWAASAWGTACAASAPTGASSRAAWSTTAPRSSTRSRACTRARSSACSATRGATR